MLASKYKSCRTNRTYIYWSSIDERALPEFEPQKLENLKVIVFAAREIGLDAPFNLVGPEDSAPLDGLLGQQVIDERPERAADPCPDGRPEPSLAPPDPLFRQHPFECSLQHVLSRQPVELQLRRHAGRHLDHLATQERHT